MRYYFTILGLVMSFQLFAVQGDSLQYLTNKDTIFLNLGEFQEKLFVHQIEAKQTLYSLCKFYAMTENELYYYNPQHKNKVLGVGDRLTIPMPNRAIKRYRNQDFKLAEHVPVFYMVKRGDTMYKISKSIFKMPIDTVMARNHLSDIDLHIGQQIHIGWMSLSGIPERSRNFRGSPESKQNQFLYRKYSQGSQVKKEHVQQGVAFWQKGGNQKADFYALHRRAPINSIIAVTNPMVNKTVYARVIGRIPIAVYEKDIVVIVSPKAAAYLGAKDARFFAKVRYLR